MKRVCAWCRTDMPEGPGPSDGAVSHGICQPCRDRLFEAEGLPALDFLASMPSPAMIVDEDRTVGALNAEALVLAERDVDDVVGTRFGLAFSCANAIEAGDCGLSDRCGGCAIRQSVAHTFRTGQSRKRVPATLRQVQGAGATDVPLRVSTRMIGHGVMVRIEGPEPDIVAFN